MQTQTAKSVLLMPRKSQRLKFIAIGSVLFLLILAVAGYLFWQHNQQLAAKASQTTILVTRGNVDVKIGATGIIRPYKQVKVSPKQTGLIQHLYVKQGDRVKKGQPIAKMDDINLKSQVDAARAAYLIANDQYEKSKRGNRPQEVASAAFQVTRAERAVSSAQQNVARLRLQIESMRAQAARDAANAQRQVYLAQTGAISEQDRLNSTTQATVSNTQLEITKQELNQAISAVGLSQAEMSTARQQHSLVQSGNRSEDVSAAMHNVMQAKANLTNLETQINDMVVRAPFDGVITQKYADEGAIVTPTTSSATNSATSSSIVALAGYLEMVAQVSEADIAKIELGQDVEIVANALPGKTFRGFVSQVAPEAIITSNVTTFEVHTELDEIDDSLMSGMNVSAKFIAGTERNAMLVPTVAIVSRKGQPGVLVVSGTGKEPEWKAVTVGPSVDNKTVVRSGLNDGDRIAMGLGKEQLEKFGYSRAGGGGAPSALGALGGAGGRGMGGGGSGRRGGGL